MAIKSFSTTNKVWLWPGANASWHFVYVDGPETKEIRKNSIKRGFGSVRVRATLGKTTWKSSIFWSAKEKLYIFPLKKSVRNIEDIYNGDEVTIKFDLI
ncbi:MAG: DUF1905 domain-containing protein [Candidatus Nomurabacteria bacterium]|nr:DUF1905 domain-containing protein [Candidatus Nomurabacteria bacterium]